MAIDGYVNLAIGCQKKERPANMYEEIHINK